MGKPSAQVIWPADWMIPILANFSAVASGYGLEIALDVIEVSDSNRDSNLHKLLDASSIAPGFPDFFDFASDQVMPQQHQRGWTTTFAKTALASCAG